MMTQTQAQVLDWLATGETDRCSETLAFWLAFGVLKEDYDHPWDAAELNRCIKLLHDVPGLQEALPKMAEVSPQWARLVPNWSRLRQTFWAEAGYDWCRGSDAPETEQLLLGFMEGKQAEEPALAD